MSAPDRASQIAFPLTRWTLVRTVQSGDEAGAARALDEICRRYWYPIYAFTRRNGFPKHDAEDITQLFFQRVITSEAIKDAQEDKGRLRSFMLAMLKRIIANHVRDAAAKKRGGSPAATLSFEDAIAEERYLHEPMDPAHDPATLFDRAWAEDILAGAEANLREDFCRVGNLTGFEQLREYLPLGDNETPYADAAKKLNLTPAALRLQIHRMRRRYAELIEEEIAQTVSTPEEAKAELEHLMKVIGSRG